MVLSDFVPDVRAIADVEAFGVVLARPERQAQLVTRHRAGVAAHLLPIERLPSALTPPASTDDGHHAAAGASRGIASGRSTACCATGSTACW